MTTLIQPDADVLLELRRMNASGLSPSSQELADRLGLHLLEADASVRALRSVRLLDGVHHGHGKPWTDLRATELGAVMVIEVRPPANSQVGGRVTTPQTRNHGRCSFCLREDVPLAELVVGPEANICASCVELVQQILTKQAETQSLVGWQTG